MSLTKEVLEKLLPSLLRLVPMVAERAHLKYGISGGSWFLALVPSDEGTIQVSEKRGDQQLLGRNLKGEAWLTRDGIGLVFLCSSREISEIVVLVVARLLDLSDVLEVEEAVLTHGTQDQYFELLALCEDLRPAA